VGVRCSMENMVVACVGVLNDKNGTNQTRMHKWMEAKLVCSARTSVPLPCRPGQQHIKLRYG
jgi:hypothetical protein